jgi:hypothetical protein
VKVQFIYYSTTLHWYTSKERHRTKYQLIKEKLLGTIIAKVFNFYFIKKNFTFSRKRMVFFILSFPLLLILSNDSHHSFKKFTLIWLL